MAVEKIAEKDALIKQTQAVNAGFAAGIYQLCFFIHCSKSRIDELPAQSFHQR
jgi:hypothetical protein